mgnify:CR=1 FL=1
MPPRYRTTSGRYISNRAGRRKLWQSLASRRLAYRNVARRVAVRSMLGKRAAKAAGARLASRAAASGAARLGGRAISRFIPYVGAALTAADIGYGLYQYFKPKPKRGKRYGDGRYSGDISYKNVTGQKAIRKSIHNSYMLSVEKSGNQTPTVAGILGHSTLSRTYAVRSLFGALLRMIMYRNGMKCNSPSQNIVPMVTGTVIGIEFQYAAATNDGFSITITAPINFTQVLDAFITAWNTKYDSLNAGLVPYDVRFRNIYIRSPASNNAPNTTEVDLINARINVYCTSTLKVQNRTVTNATDDDIDDVDNVPLNLVGYSGYGTGLDSRYDFLGLGFCANQDCIIQTSDPALAGDAPLPALLQGVKSTGTNRLQPGAIKTTRLSDMINVSLDTYTRHVLGPRGNGNLKLPLGKFSFIHYEKTIEANNASPVAMNIAYENQLYMNAKIIVKSNDIPIPEFYRS